MAFRSQDPWVQELGVHRPDLLLDSFAAEEAEVGETQRERQKGRSWPTVTDPGSGRGSRPWAQGPWKSSSPRCSFKGERVSPAGR